MAPVKIERVISVSSEDEAHSAANLLKIDYSNKKWKCKTPGENQISVVLQLAQFCKIISVDIGNEHSAFIEILVGKSCSSNDDYKVLLVSSSLMTLQEAKLGTNVNGVTFFKEKNLCRPVCEEKWDRIKIVCTQPFNRHVQYGLSFVVFHTEATQIVNSSPIGNLTLKAATSVEPLLQAGGLFANRKKLSNEPIPRGAAAIRAASVTADVKLDNLGNIPHKNDVSDSSKSPKVSSDREEGKKKTKKKDDTGKNEVKAKKKRNSLNGNSRKAASSSPKKKVVRATVQPFKKREERPFNYFMTGVVFAISGYENPLRSELRNKAMAMGARYEANWNSNCTHLICAFRNTPKYHQVRGHGKIVKKEWIEECFSRRVRLPWRRFALDPNDASQAESEEEIYEEIKRPSPPKKRACSESSEDAGDTDDEIEKVRRKQKKLNGVRNIDEPSTSGINNRLVNNTQSKSNDEDNISSESEAENNVAKVTRLEKFDDHTSATSSTENQKIEVKNDIIKKEETNIYDMETESEDESYWVKSGSKENSLPPLSAFFQDATIALLDDLSLSERKLLTRYIKAHKGAIADDSTDLNTILYAITEDSKAIERIKEDFPQVIGVTPEWIWRSHDEDKLLPASSFKVIQ